MVPIIVAHRRAGFVIGADVGQLVVAAKGFAIGPCAHAAGDVQFLRRHVLPNAIEGAHVRRIAGQRGDVRHSGVHVHGAHGVSPGDGLGLVHHFLLRFHVRVPGALLARIRTARIQHELRQAQIALVAGGAVELGESHFHDLVAGPDGALVRPESPVEQVGGTQRNVQQRTLLRGLIMRHGGFVQMAQVVQFVAVHALQNPAPVAGPRMRVRRIDGAGGVQVSVRLLRRRDLLDQPIHVGFQLRVGVHA